MRLKEGARKETATSYSLPSTEVREREREQVFASCARGKKFGARLGAKRIGTFETALGRGREKFTETGAGETRKRIK